jgi:hypothetical protein
VLKKNPLDMPFLTCKVWIEIFSVYLGRGQCTDRIFSWYLRGAGGAEVHLFQEGPTPQTYITTLGTIKGIISLFLFLI